MKVYTTFILSASITRGVTYAKLTHTVARGRYTTAPTYFLHRPRGIIDRDKFKLGKWILPSWFGVVATSSTPQIVYTSYSDWHSLMGERGVLCGGRNHLRVGRKGT